MNLYLMLVILLCFCTVASAGEGVLWPDNAGFDPDTGQSWNITDKGTLEGWQDSNFETLEYQTAGKSELVGTGITVAGIKVNWRYPGSGNIGKGGDIDLDQSIDYTVVALAEIPCVLKMNIFGNGGGNGSQDEIAPLYGENDIPDDESHLMLFSPNMGGIVDVGWNFKEVGADEYAAGQAEGFYINACDLWTADLWANVPYGFTVSSAGMGESAGLEEPLKIQMRYLQRTDIGSVSQESGLELYDNNYWVGDFELDEEGVEVGTYEAGQNSHINMQFRVLVTGAPAGRYMGEVTFSTYTI